MTSKRPLKKIEEPHWNFEAFRNFISFEVLQQACSALRQHEGITVGEAASDLRHLNSLLFERTGLEWTPDRVPGGNVNWETEGSLFRNKKRLLTSMYLIDLGAYEDADKLYLTPLGRALGEGRVGRDQFYDFVISKFGFPHPAYEENWSWWTSKRRELRPLLFILKLLLHLSQLTGHPTAVSIKEVAFFGGPNPETKDSNDVAKAIAKYRSAPKSIKHKRKDSHDRKIGDMFGFLSMTKYAALGKGGLVLNPVRQELENKCRSWISLSEIESELDNLGRL